VSVNGLRSLQYDDARIVVSGSKFMALFFRPADSSSCDSRKRGNRRSHLVIPQSDVRKRAKTVWHAHIDAAAVIRAGSDSAWLV